MTSTLQEVASQVPGAIKDAVVGEITIAGYILARLKQLDVTHLMYVLLGSCTLSLKRMSLLSSLCCLLQGRAG